MMETTNFYRRSYIAASDFIDHHSKLLWSLLLAIQFLLPFPFVATHKDIPDEDAYQNLAQNIVDHHAYFLNWTAFHEASGQPNTYYAPAWPAVLAAGYAIVHRPIGFWVASGIVWCICLTMVWMLGRSLGLNPIALWMLLAWFSTNPLYAYYHLHLMTETLGITIATAILAIGMRYVKQPSWQLACALGALAGLGQLTRTALLFPFIAVWIVFFARPFRLRFSFAALSLATYLAVVSPWLVRMHSVNAGFSSTELKLGQNLFLYNYPKVNNPYKIRSDEHIEFPPGLEQMTPAKRDALLTRYGVAEIVNYPTKYVRNCLRRAFYLLSPLPNFYTSSFRVAAALVCITLLYLFMPWAVVISLLLKGAARVTTSEAILLTAILIWYLFHILLHGSIRQRLPSDLWVAALAISMCQRFGGSILPAAVRSNVSSELAPQPSGTP